MEHAPKAQKKEYFMPGATYFMNRFWMIRHSSLKFTKMAYHHLIRTSVFSLSKESHTRWEKIIMNIKKIKQTYVISLCIIACQRIWSEIKKRRKKKNFGMTFCTIRMYYIRLIFYCFCRYFKMNNMNSTVHNSQLLLSLQPFLLRMCDNMTSLRTYITYFF